MTKSQKTFFEKKFVKNFAYLAIKNWSKFYKSGISKKITREKA